MKTICLIEPVGKPRMTQRDKWMKRKCVVKYRRFCDDLRRCVGDRLPPDAGQLSVVAYFTMPASWSNKKKMISCGGPHRARPDADNILKAVADALFKEDSGLWKMSCEKRWEDGNGPRIELEVER